MNHDATLTLVPTTGAMVPQATVDLVEYVVRGAGAVIKRSLSFPKRAAMSFWCEGVPAEALRIIVGKRLVDQKIDLIVQDGVASEKKLLLADMESTVIEQEMLVELAMRCGCQDVMATMTERAMNGDVDFVASLQERVALLKGLSVTALEEVAARITFMAGAEPLTRRMKAQGAQCWLVSGGFSCFVRPVAEKLGFDRYFANELILKDGVLTGEVQTPVLDSESKKKVLSSACAELGLGLDEVITVGDGTNDVPMLRAAHEAGGLGIAYHAKPRVRAAVPNQVNYGDLTALLFAQGDNAQAAIRR